MKDTKKIWREKYPLLGKIQNAKYNTLKAMRNDNSGCEDRHKVLVERFESSSKDYEVIRTIENHYDNRKIFRYKVDESHKSRNSNPLKTHIQRIIWDMNKSIRKMYLISNPTPEDIIKVKRFIEKKKNAEMDLEVVKIIEKKYMS